MFLQLVSVKKDKVGSCRIYLDSTFCFTETLNAKADFVGHSEDTHSLTVMSNIKNPELFDGTVEEARHNCAKKCEDFGQSNYGGCQAFVFNHTTG